MALVLWLNANFTIIYYNLSQFNDDYL